MLVLSGRRAEREQQEGAAKPFERYLVVRRGKKSGSQRPEKQQGRWLSRKVGLPWTLQDRNPGRRQGSFLDRFIRPFENGHGKAGGEPHPAGQAINATLMRALQDPAAACRFQRYFAHSEVPNPMPGSTQEVHGIPRSQRRLNLRCPKAFSMRETTSDHFKRSRHRG